MGERQAAGQPRPGWVDDEAASTAAVAILYAACHAEAEAELLGAVLPRIVAAAAGTYAAVVAATAGRWQTVCETGAGPQIPLALLADCLDWESAVEDGSWQAVPLSFRSSPAEVLVVAAPAPVRLLASLAGALAEALRQVRQRATSGRRLRRMEVIQRIAQQWYGVSETSTLLVQMAEAATELLGADRASIFLWDRATKTLVGRPALGIEGNELRIAEDAGVVGQTIASGQPHRVGRADDASEIDRQVDAQLRYSTETLLCVPIDSPAGKRLGAFEVLNRHEGDFTDDDQFDLVELACHAAIALENTQQLEELLTSHRQIVDQAAAGVQLIGRSAAIDALRATADRVAQTDLAILVLGENGTGKEVLSQSIHYRSRRRDQPFIAVNCAAITETLLESELFGHEKGSFTDAHEARPGKFELASGGTLFLDEIGDMSPGGQGKLLRVLEEKIVVRVGGSTPIHTDVRVIAATNQKLAELVAGKKFREDLYYRLNVVTLELAPLRARGDDILLLAEHFLAQFCRNAGRKVPKFSAAARKRLMGHPWPGNVRELRNLMERLAYLLPGEQIEVDDLAFILSPGEKQAAGVDLDLPLAEATRQFQADHIQRAIDAARGNMTDAAARLGLHRSNLYRKMGQLGVSVLEDEP